MAGSGNEAISGNHYEPIRKLVKSSRFPAQNDALVPSLSMRCLRTPIGVENIPCASLFAQVFYREEWGLPSRGLRALIPADENGPPGALELGVPEFIDRKWTARSARRELVHAGPFASAAPNSATVAAHAAGVTVPVSPRWMPLPAHVRQPVFSELPAHDAGLSANRLGKRCNRLRERFSTSFLRLLLQNTRRLSADPILAETRT